MKASTINISSTYLGHTGQKLTFDISAYEWIVMQQVPSSSSTLPTSLMNTGGFSLPKSILIEGMKQWYTNGPAVTFTNSTLTFSSTLASYNVHIWGVNFK